MAEMKELTNENYKESLEGKNSILFIYKEGDPLNIPIERGMTASAKQLNAQMALFKMLFESNPEAMETLSVTGTPTLIVSKEGNIVWRKTGMPAPSDAAEIDALFLS